MLHILRKIRSEPVNRLRSRVVRRLGREVLFAVQRRRDRRRSTLMSDGDFLIHLGIERDGLDEFLGYPSRFLDSDSLQIDLRKNTGDEAGYRFVARAAAEHRFAILGSNYLTVSYDLIAPGAFDSRYAMAPGPGAESDQLGSMAGILDEAAVFVADDSMAIRRIRGLLESYRPIDWHVDIKSGYRWDPDTWMHDIPIGRSPGADVKVPWELSRCHHLVAMALDTSTGGPEEDRADEVCLQILDWLAANPPRFGVNWRSAMDVAIRSANWVWAIALLGDRVPPALRWLVAKSLYQHAVHVEGNLDYVSEGTNNHYLSEIAGLLHVVAALPRLPEAPAWAALGLQELRSELDRTIYGDGASYEGSTGYHRLVAETFLHGTMAALRLPETLRRAAKTASGVRKASPQVLPSEWAFDPADPAVFPADFWAQLKSTSAFTSEITKPNGLAAQIGDQDSGRFLKFDWPGAVRDNGEFVEEPRDHRHLLATSRGLYEDHSSESKPYPIERAVGSAPGVTIPPAAGHVSPKIVRHEWTNGQSVWHSDSGYYVARSGPFWLCVHSERVPNNTPTGHRHNDQLSFELNIGGVDFFIDPGTGVYTPDPVLRNHLRATASHNTVSVVGKEQRTVTPGVEGLFASRGDSRAEAVSVTSRVFTAVHRWSGIVHHRSFVLGDDRLVIDDRVETDRQWTINYIISPDVTVTTEPDSGRVSLVCGPISLTLRVQSDQAQIHLESIPFSPAYGRLESATRLAIAPSGAVFKTVFEIGRSD